MTEFLKRWAALQPDWCRVDDERASVMTAVGTPLERPRFTAQFHRLGQYEPHILAAVIEAIEAHPTWEWTIWGGSQAVTGARIIIPSSPGRDVRAYGERAASPAAALLAAYLAALEAEAGQ